jgi:hypothetical protein
MCLTNRSVDLSGVCGRGPDVVVLGDLEVLQRGLDLNVGVVVEQEAQP